MKPLFHHRSAYVCLTVAAALSACGTRSTEPGQAAGYALRAAWVELVPQPQVRAVVSAGAGCPALTVDGRTLPMAVRVAASMPAQRPTASQPSKPAAFPVEVCTADLPGAPREVRIDGRALPAPHAPAQRIVVVGDTGCRIKGNDLQDCTDTDAAWPFGRIAAAAAAVKPDLVIHVGDYHYRETPCPADKACRESPWGYGWDAWQADFFDPAAPLLAAAPWVMLRGNHEECDRAGQGWSRLLAPENYLPQRSCDDPYNDDLADFTPPYAVPLGGDTQLIVFDSAHAGNAPLRPGVRKDQLVLDTYRAQMRAVNTMSAISAPAGRPGLRSWFLSHHPVLAFAPDEKHPNAPYPGNQALQAAMRELAGDAYFPPGVQAALHGHVHLFQAIDFSSGHPATLVAGNGGDSLDTSLPHPFPAGLSPAQGAVVAQMTHASRFGFLVLERAAPFDGVWQVHAHRSDGGVLARCTLSADKAVHCEP